MGRGAPRSGNLANRGAEDDKALSCFAVLVWVFRNAGTGFSVGDRGAVGGRDTVGRWEGPSRGDVALSFGGLRTVLGFGVLSIIVELFVTQHHILGASLAGPFCQCMSLLTFHDYSL